jgi:hypothetical protein
MIDDAQSLPERCGTSLHATEALLTILQEQDQTASTQPYRYGWVLVTCGAGEGMRQWVASSLLQEAKAMSYGE